MIVLIFCQGYLYPFLEIFIEKKKIILRAHSSFVLLSNFTFISQVLV